MNLWTNDGRRRDDGRTTAPAYTISSSGAFGSGELKVERKETFYTYKMDKWKSTVNSNYIYAVKTTVKTQHISKKCDACGSLFAIKVIMHASKYNGVYTVDA